jgi:LmbE family N-acetylglucosaminyl deacetylase
MRIDHTTRLFVVAPHPDDEVDGVGGLIGKVKKEKGKIFILYMGVGDSRQLVTGTTRAKDRLKEIQAVKKLTGAAVQVMYVQKDHVKLDAVPQKDIVEKLDDIVERFKPNLMAVPASSSYNQDHRATFDACIAALRPTPRSARHFVENVLEYFEPYFWAARPAKTPNAYLDLDEKFGRGNLFDFKAALYRCHATQMRQDPFPRSLENMERMAHIYGKEIGATLAEAYHVVRTAL